MASRGTATWATRFALALTIMVSLGACGGDDDGDEGGGEAGDGAGAGGGGGGMSGGAGGAGGRAGSVATAGAGGAGGLGGLPMATCDTSIPTTATCGGTACPASMSPAAALTCSVPCCTDDDECGLRNAIDGMVTDCAGPAEEDPNCPHYTGAFMGMNLDLPGCCHSTGKCGAISSISMSCIVTSAILTDLMPGDDCGDDAEDGGN